MQRETNCDGPEPSALSKLKQFHRHELQGASLHSHCDVMVGTLERLANGTNQERERAKEIIHHICERAVRCVAAGRTAAAAVQHYGPPEEHAALTYECLAFVRFVLSKVW